MDRDVIIQSLMDTIEVQTQGKSIGLIFCDVGGMKMAGEDDKKKSAGGVFLAIVKKSPK